MSYARCDVVGSADLGVCCRTLFMSPSAATYSTASRPAATHPAAAAAASRPATAFTSADFAENFTHLLPRREQQSRYWHKPADHDA